MPKNSTIPETPPVAYEVTRQGEILVNGCYLRKGKKGIAIRAIALETRSKYPEVLATGEGHDGVPAIMLTASERTLNKHKTATDHTKVEFSDFKGWEIWCVEATKNEIHICLIK
jgi:hypothetical protein